MVKAEVKLTVDALGLLLLHGLRELDAAVFAADITRQGMQTAGAGVVLLHRRFEDLFASAGDVDLGAVGDEGLGDHEANSRASSGHDGGEKADIELEADSRPLVSRATGGIVSSVSRTSSEAFICSFSLLPVAIVAR